MTNKNSPPPLRFNKSLDDFNYDNREITEIIKEELTQVQFLGVSGTVAFDEAGDRISWTQIEQMVNGKYIPLGFYDTNTENLTWNEAEQWVGGRPPRDRTEIVPTLVTVSRPLFLALSTCSSVGIVAAFALLLFNYRCRANRYIQMSHPSSNNLMLLGAVLCFISVMLFGLDGQDVGTEYFEVICNVSWWELDTKMVIKAYPFYFLTSISREPSSSRWAFRSSSAPCSPRPGSAMCCTRRTSERSTTTRYT